MRTGLALLGGVAFASAAATWASSSGAAAARCGSPIPRAGARGPIVGPIQFRGIRRAAVPASKVLLWTREATNGAVVITGRNCADGTPMRLWYGGKPELPDTITSTTGDLSYVLHGSAGSGRPGYLLWSTSGNWKLTVSRAGRPLGTLVFCVSATTGSSRGCS
jgi:hypothetical protein